MFNLFVQVKGDEDRFYIETLLYADSMLDKAVLTGPDQTDYHHTQEYRCRGKV